jgi:hypothetical protein
MAIGAFLGDVGVGLQLTLNVWAEVGYITSVAPD